MPSAEITPITLIEVVVDERLPYRRRRLFAHNPRIGIGAHRARPRGRRPYNVGTAYRHRRCRRPASRGRGRTRARGRRRRAEPGAAGGFRLRSLCQERYAPDIGRRQGEGQRMSFLFDVFTVMAVSTGVFFFLAGSIGLLRFPDALSRLHALTKADNVGLGLVMLGLLPRAGGLLAGKRPSITSPSPTLSALVSACRRDSA